MHAYLAIDERLHDDHLGGPMHLLDFTGQRMPEPRIEPHQIALRPLHVGVERFGPVSIVLIRLSIQLNVAIMLADRTVREKTDNTNIVNLEFIIKYNDQCKHCKSSAYGTRKFHAGQSTVEYRIFYRRLKLE